MSPINKYSHKQIRTAIMQEIGTDERTIEVTVEKMTELKMLKKGEMGFMEAEKIE